MSQTLTRAKIQYIKYGRNKKLKIRCIGNIREDIVTELDITIQYLPDNFKMALSRIKHVEIVETKDKKTVVGSHLNNGVIMLFDRKWIDVYEYSGVFLHELAHEIFDVIVDSSTSYDPDEPLWQFTETVNSKHIKPISDYSYRLKDHRTKYGKLSFAGELFAEYFAFTYSRYCDEDETKGTFCNYIELRNAFWSLIDGWVYKD